MSEPQPHLSLYTVEIKTTVSPRGDEENLPIVPSLYESYPMVDWHERESYDLLGINFVGHPNLKRILLPEDWNEEGDEPPFPLRKDIEQKQLRFSAREIPKEGLKAAKEIAEKKAKKQ